MKKIIKNDIFMARRFNNTMRYIDDLNNIQFNDAIQDILYPSELQLKKTMESPTTLFYLLRCMIRGIVFTLTSYIFQMSYNIPSKPADGVCFPTCMYR